MRLNSQEIWVYIVFDAIRELASSFEYQMLYARMQDGLDVEFFVNKKDFTENQLTFLYWLQVYHGLYQSLSMDEPYLNDEVIKNPIRCDAYLRFRKKLKDEKMNIENNRHNNSFRNNKKGRKVPVSGIPTVVYKGN